MSKLARRALRLFAAALPATLLGCASGPAPICTAQPIATIAARNDGGVEDIVAITLSNGTTRLLFRDPCDGACRQRADGAGISYVDIGGPVEPPPKAEMFWRPRAGDAFAPLGLALLPRADGSFVLFVIDETDRRGTTKLWAVAIGKDGRAGETIWEIQDARFEHANDLLAIPDGDGFVVFVSRYDALGFFPWGREPWPGIVRVAHGADGKDSVERLSEGLRGANGMAAPGWLPTSDPLLVSDYWEQTLRGLARDGTTAPRLAHALDFHPDNLTLARDGQHVLAAGQRCALLAGLNLLWSAVPSPSQVAAIGPPLVSGSPTVTPLWRGGFRAGASVSVAVPIGQNRLALGQINRPEILIVQCAPHPALQ